MSETLPTLSIRFTGDESAVKNAYEDALIAYYGLIVSQSEPKASKCDKYAGSWIAYLTVLVGGGK